MPITGQSLSILFRQWCRQERASKQLLILAMLAMIIHFTWFKILYPYPNFIPDSYRYIIAAQADAFADMRPVGYSRFLRIVSCFTTSHLVLVFIQFVLLQAAGLYLLFTIGYLFQSGKWLLWTLVLLQACNPLLSHTSNLISSDALFISLSLVWFTQLLWMQYRPTPALFLSHALILLLAFSVRYNALWYPLISFIAIFFSRIRLMAKLGYTSIIVVSLALFVSGTKTENQRRFGVNIFSGFSGWQLAANALTVYEHLPPDPVTHLPLDLQPLHRLVNKHMDSIRHYRQKPDSTMNVYYMWGKSSPLNAYMPKNGLGQNNELFVKEWIMTGPLYDQYGRYLIQHHPGAFLYYFIQPNLKNYFFPNPEFLGIYGTGSNSIGDEAVAWFKLTSNTVSYRGATRVQIMNWFLPIQFFSNLLFILAGLSLVLLGELATKGIIRKKIFWITVLVWAANLGFNTLASIVVLRYQVFILILAVAFSILFIESIIRLARGICI